MKHASIALSLDADIHLVLCRFGRAGLAYVETDPAEADATTVIRTCCMAVMGSPAGRSTQRERKLVARCFRSDGIRVREIAEREHYELTHGTLDFIEAHMGRLMQPTLPFW